MNRVEILDGMEPFNELYYKDCFYSALFPIVKYFGKSLLPFISNALFLYDFDMNAEIINIKEIVQYHREELLRRNGMLCAYKKIEGNIVDAAVSSLSEGRPVIVLINDYYNPLRLDSYLKISAPHHVLLYGFNKGEKTFHVIESRYRGTIIYEKMALCFADLEKCFYDVSIENKYMEFSQDTSQLSPGASKADGQTENAASRYLSFINRNTENMSYALESLRQFQRHLEEIIRKEGFCENTANQWITAFDIICNRKAIDKYIAKKLPGADDYIKISNEIYGCWFGARAKTTKAMLSGKISDKYVDAMVNSFEGLYKLETEYLELLGRL